MAPDAPAFEPQPSLLGRTLRLRPLASDDLESLYGVAADPLIWAQHPSPTRYQRPVFESWFANAMASGGALVVHDRDSQEIIGSSRYYDWDAAAKSVAIGFTFLARAYWGGPANAELKQLMLDHAFRWVDTVWFHVGPENLRSQKALAKIGAQLSHQGVTSFAGVEQSSLFYVLRRAVDQ